MVSVEYLNYEILDDFGWSLDDDDLFEIAQEAELDERDHGEIEVQAGQEILLAAEADGHDGQWMSCSHSSIPRRWMQRK